MKKFITLMIFTLSMLGAGVIHAKTIEGTMQHDQKTVCTQMEATDVVTIVATDFYFDVSPSITSFIYPIESHVEITPKINLNKPPIYIRQANWLSYRGYKPNYNYIVTHKPNVTIEVNCRTENC